MGVELPVRSLESIPCFLLSEKLLYKMLINNLFTDDWNKESHPYTKLEYGKWEINIPPAADGSCVIKHLSEIKVQLNVQSCSVW